MWFIVALVVGVGLAWLIMFTRGRNIKITWYEWLIGIIGLLLLLFTIQNAVGVPKWWDGSDWVDCTVYDYENGNLTFMQKCEDEVLGIIEWDGHSFNYQRRPLFLILLLNFIASHVINVSSVNIKVVNLKTLTPINLFVITLNQQPNNLRLRRERVNEETVIQRARNR